MGPGVKMVVGLTGGIGTGKSSLLNAFGRAGAATISLDDLSHDLSRKGGPLHRNIVREFGTKYLSASGELDRRALGQAVFARPGLRRRLERATHPTILRKMRQLIADSRSPVIVADVPLLFEAGVQKSFDAVVVVSAPRNEALRRVMRRGMSRAETLRRMQAQWPLERKERAADIVIRNQGSLKDLSRKAREYYRAFQLIANHHRGGT